jgi:hypothetical protein
LISDPPIRITNHQSQIANHKGDRHLRRQSEARNTAPVDPGWNRFPVKPAVCVEVDADHLSVVGKASEQIAGIFR